MKLRAAVTVAVGALVGVVVACGGSGESTFPGENGEGTGGDPPPGFVGDSGLTPSSLGCRKLSCADQGITCGPAGDGCGGKIDDCGTCTAPQTCGGGGTPSVCGGNAGCVPRTCAELGVECGFAGDGCGGLLDCNQPPLGCTPPQFCGGGGPSKCGSGQLLPDGGALLPDGGLCTPRTTCMPNECGPVADGCGNILTCPGCPAGTTCGGANVPSMCGAPTCTKKTCGEQNANCGYAPDGCGGLLDCGGPDACTNPGEFCGGGGPNRCGTGGDAGASCTNLCLLRPTDCSGPNTPNTTTIKGVVYMPNGTLPVYGATVYVPNGPLDPMPEGNTPGVCDSCAAQISGLPLVHATTNYKGEFTLTDMPHGDAIPVVIQAGRWRKQITVSTTRCGTVDLSPVYPQPPTENNTTFGSEHTPKNHIPKFAVTSGGADALQCLLRKIGIADKEFTQPAGPGRVNLFAGTGGTTRYRNNFNGLTGTSPWSSSSQNTRNLPPETYLYGNSSSSTVDTSVLDQYDAVVLSCTGEGDQQGSRSGYRAEMKQYADRGGKVFASHWHHAWLEHGPAPWGTSGGVAGGKLATIEHEEDLVNPVTATINTAPSFPKGNALADWLVHANNLAGTTPQPRGYISIIDAQHTITAVDTTRATPWITITAPITERSGSTTNKSSVQYFDFFTPVGAETQCGRVVISDLHVSRDRTDDGSGGSNNGFPNNCTSTGMTDQERVLAFMLFDLTSCIPPVDPPPPPTCEKKTCAELGVVCGEAGDGCGGFQTCDPCPPGQLCQNNMCITPECTKTSCPAEGAECGIIADGCGGTIQCPPCDGGVCGGNGPNKCGLASCTPITCEDQGIECGPAGNGCGQQIDCGPCPPGQTCGGGGVHGKCGAPNCTKRTCLSAGAQCGFVADGCGGLLDCGVCPPGQTCGGITPNQCASSRGPN